MVETAPSSMGPSTDWMATYIRTPQGILRICEMVFSLIAFLCSVVVDYGWWPHLGGGWVNFVAITAFVLAAIFFALHLLNFNPRVTIFYYVEFIVYCVFCACFLIAGIVAAARADQNKYSTGHQSVGAASFFCFLCMILWAVDAVLQFLEIRNGPVTTTSSSSEPPTAAGAADPYPGPSY